MDGDGRGVQVLLAEDGDVIQFDAHGGRIADKVPAGRVLIDVTRVGEVGEEVLRDRRHLAEDGLVVAVVAISRAGGQVVGEPEVIARGYVVDEDDAPSLFRDASGVIAGCIEASSIEERTDQGLMTEKIRIELRRFFKKRSGRRPLVLPVLMEI
jgi:ribonuclease J